MAGELPQIVWTSVILLAVVLAFVKTRQKRAGRRRSVSIGPAAAGAIYDLLNQDKRNAIELIVEQKAEARDPQTAGDIVDPHAHH